MTSPARTQAPGLGIDPGQPIPYTLTAKAHAALDQDNSRSWREEDTPATTGPDEWGCGQCGAARFGTPPEDGLCPACRAGEDSR
jgi:rubrerythrin